MYAVVECGGKQYKVEKDMLVKVEKIDAEIGDVIELKVSAKVNAQDKFPKVYVFHYKSKKNIRKRQGHRQPYTELKIVSIEG